MKKIIIIILAVFIISCGTTDHETLMQESVPYMNMDAGHALNIYLIDSLSLNINKYQVVHSDKTGHTFIIPDYIWTASRFSEKRMLSDPSCYLLEWDLGDYVKNLSGSPIFLKIKFRLPDFEIWDRKAKNRMDRRKTYYPIYFKKQPDYYYLMLIRGDALNCMKHGNPTGARFTKLDFGDEKCYYKVLFPAWNDHKPQLLKSASNLPIVPIP